MTDPALVGLGLWVGLCVVAGGILRRPPATIAAWAATGGGFYLLGRDPHLGVTVLVALALYAVRRYGIRHLLLYGGLALVSAAIIWTNMGRGMLLPAALGNAADRMVWFVALTWAAFTLWQIVTGRLGYLTNPLAWAAETRRLRETAEYKRAKGRGGRGLGWAGRRTRQAITGRTPPALPRPPDTIDQLNQRDLLIHARRAGIKPAEHTTDELRGLVREARQRPPEPATARPHPPGPPPPTAEAGARTVPRNADGINRPRAARPPTVLDVPPEVYEPDDLGMPAPLFHWREPILRIRP